MSRAPIDGYRLAQAREALADNTARAKLPDPARAAAIRVEMELGTIVETQLQWHMQRNIAAAHREAWLRQVRAIWRGAERDIEKGGQL